MPNPDVTIIIPVCGGGTSTLPGVQRALASIGDDPTVEILLPDDQTDALAGLWLLAQATADRRLHVVRIKPGAGPAHARNVGIDVARAPLIAFLEPGDRWRRGKLGPQRALHAGHPDIGFSFTDAALQPAGSEQGTALAAARRFHLRHGAHRTAFLVGPDAVAQLYAENVVALSTVVARTDLLRAAGGFAADIEAAAAWDLWVRLAAQAPAACRPEVTAETAACSAAALACMQADLAPRHAVAARKARLARRPARQLGLAALADALRPAVPAPAPSRIRTA